MHKLLFYSKFIAGYYVFFNTCFRTINFFDIKQNYIFGQHFALIKCVTQLLRFSSLKNNTDIDRDSYNYSRSHNYSELPSL